MFKFCPMCKSSRISFERNRVFRCPDCNFVYYNNVAAATGCIIHREEDILFSVREKDPARGKLDLPGGFVDPDEGALECLCRECQEELGWCPSENITFFASFPNTYPYKNVIYKTCDMYFTVFVPNVKESDFKIDPSEINSVRFVKKSEINFDDIAFDSTKRAIKAFLSKFGLNKE